MNAFGDRAKKRKDRRALLQSVSLLFFLAFSFALVPCQKNSRKSHINGRDLWWITAVVVMYLNVVPIDYIELFECQWMFRILHVSNDTKDFFGSESVVCCHGGKN